jgi:hypothetical protein
MTHLLLKVLELLLNVSTTWTVTHTTRHHQASVDSSATLSTDIAHTVNDISHTGSRGARERRASGGRGSQTQAEGSLIVG